MAVPVGAAVRRYAGGVWTSRSSGSGHERFGLPEVGTAGRMGPFRRKIEILAAFRAGAGHLWLYEHDRAGRLHRGGRIQRFPRSGQTGHPAQVHDVPHHHGAIAGACHPVCQPHASTGKRGVRGRKAAAPWTGVQHLSAKAGSFRIMQAAWRDSASTRALPMPEPQKTVPGDGNGQSADKATTAKIAPINKEIGGNFCFLRQLHLHPWLAGFFNALPGC